MSRYPIKMLKDESGQPFVPLTHVMAVAGEEYTTAILIANKLSKSHYQIVNDDLNTNILKDKIIAVKFDEIGEIDNISYLKINNDAEYPFYKADGLNPLILSGLDESVCLFTFNDNKWKLTLVGTDGSSGGGHAITDYKGSVMTQRSVLNFDGATVKDDPSNGATTVKTGWISQKFILKDDVTVSGLWQPMSANAITLPQTGIYGIHIRLKLQDISSIGKEIGIRIKINDSASECEEWIYQFKRLNTTYNFFLPLRANDTIMPELFIDNITSTDTTTIVETYMYIEYINTKEVDA